jgi:hypothetical protein
MVGSRVFSNVWWWVDVVGTSNVGGSCCSAGMGHKTHEYGTMYVRDEIGLGWRARTVSDRIDRDRQAHTQEDEKEIKRNGRIAVKKGKGR